MRSLPADIVGVANTLLVRILSASVLIDVPRIVILFKTRGVGVLLTLYIRRIYSNSILSRSTSSS